MPPIVSTKTTQADRLTRLRELTRRTIGSWSDAAMINRMEEADSYVSIMVQDDLGADGTDRREAYISASQRHAALTICAGASTTESDDKRVEAWRQERDEIIKALNGRRDTQHTATVDFTTGVPAAGNDIDDTDSRFL